MTLVICVVGPEYAIHVSDRRVSSFGRSAGSQNKAMVLDSPHQFRAVVSYAGLAR
jgi:hypothetical protein